MTMNFGNYELGMGFIDHPLNLAFTTVTTTDLTTATVGIGTPD
ncbi:hypothetical protein [Rhizobium wenxiniae]|nr:hypothetical protein [Rhizobium wenxiniae]